MHSHFALLCNKRGRLLCAPITLFYGRQNGRWEVKLGKLVDLCRPSKVPKASIGRREHISGLQILLNCNKEVLIYSDKDLFVLCKSVRGNDLPDERMPSPRTWCTSDGRVANLSFCPQIYQVQQFVQICEGARGTMKQLGGSGGPRNTRLPGSAGYLAWTVSIVTRHCNKRLMGQLLYD